MIRSYTNNDFEKELEEAKEKALKCDAKKIPLEKQLKEIVGMENVKEQLRKWNAYVKFIKKSSKKGINISDNSFHMIFEGNPGTGKTMIAKVVANMLYSIGIIPTNKCVTISAADTMKSRIGEGTEVIKKYIAKAYGGVLFIDEAYVWGDKTYVTTSGGNSANECIIPLLTAMEEYKDKLVVIFAGYHDGMKEFLKANDGLESRIGCVIHFADYNPLELTNIYSLKAINKGFTLDDEAIEKVSDLMNYFCDVNNFGNGRFVEKVLTNTIIKKSQDKKDKDIDVIKGKDIPTIKEMIEIGFNKNLLLPNALDKETIKIISYHELGHALVAYTSKKEVKFITTVPCGDGSLGGAFIERKMKYSRSKNDIENDIIELLAGRACEEVLTGTISDGCVLDIKTAKEAAEYMLSNYFFGFDNENVSVETILNESYKKAINIIEDNKQVILKIADILIKDRTLTGKTLIQLFKRNNVKTMFLNTN